MRGISEFVIVIFAFFLETCMVISSATLFLVIIPIPFISFFIDENYGKGMTKVFKSPVLNTLFWVSFVFGLLAPFILYKMGIDIPTFGD